MFVVLVNNYRKPSEAASCSLSPKLDKGVPPESKSSKTHARRDWSAMLPPPAANSRSGLLLSSLELSDTQD